MEKCNICRTSLVEEANYYHTCGAIVKNTTTQEFFVPGGKVTKNVRKLLQEGKVSRINVKNDIGKALLEIQVRAGIMSVLPARWLAEAGGGRCARDEVHSLSSEDESGVRAVVGQKGPALKIIQSVL